MNYAHQNAIRFKGKTATALRDFWDKPPEYQKGKVVGGWQDNEQDGLKIQFEDGEIQDVPFDFLEIE